MRLKSLALALPLACAVLPAYAIDAKPAAVTGVKAPAAKKAHGCHDYTKAKEPSTRAYARAMNVMHSYMNIGYTGNADIDFVNGMIPHHQGAVTMSEIVLKYGKDPVIAELAKRIIQTQETEIALMQTWLRGKTSSYRMDGAASETSVIAYKKAMADMHQGMMVGYSGNADIDFVRGMIPHHQGAIDMAWVLKREGMSLELREFANDIIRTQSQEIDLMQDWLKDRPAAAPQPKLKKKKVIAKNAPAAHH